MATNTQFSIAVHLMVGLAYFADRDDTTSGALANSVNTSPSFVRRILAKLSKARLVKTCMGKDGSCSLARDAKQISLLEIYKAVEAPKAFAIHHYSEQQGCTVSRNMKMAQEKALAKTQAAMESALADISLMQVLTDVKKK